MKNITKTLFVLALGLPLLSFAATYSYVATSGDIMTIEAETAESAIANAPNRALHSGVALGVVGSVNSVAYQYVDEDGNIESVMAGNAEDALLLSEGDRVETSGVVLAGLDPIDPNMRVNL